MFKLILPLSSIIALRFLGLFLVLPLLSVYAIQLQGATTTLVGLVIGGYALTQMIFQIPFGLMSDKLGRKGTIVTGLILFAIGSIVCAIAEDILLMLLGRFLQGAGAIAAVITAMISDLVKEEQRPKAMAIMGSFIGMSFAVSMLAGPTIGAYTGVSFLFYATAFMALISIYIILKKVPNPPKITHTYNGKSKFKEVFLNSNLIKMNITNFLQKGLMTFAFMIIPMVLIKTFSWDLKDLWQVYLPSMFFGILAMAPAAIIAEKKGKFKEILIAGVVLFAISYLIIGFSSSSLVFCVGVVIFFVGFNMHEPIMQSLATKFAKVHQKGFTLAIFNSFGYLGTFLGGLLGGIYYETVSLDDLVIIISIICIFWTILIFTIPNPIKMKNLYISLSEIDKSKLENLHKLESITEWYINDSEKLVIIKYNDEILKEEALLTLIK